MSVYLDVLFFINGVMNFFVLTLLSILFGFYGTVKNRLLASGVGALLACGFFMICPFAGGGEEVIASILISGILLVIAYGRLGLRAYIKRFLCLYLVTAMVGGAISWLIEKTEISYYVWLFLKTPSMKRLYLKSFCLISFGVFLCLIVLGSVGKMAKEEQKFLYPVTMQWKGKTIHTMGLLDTGNRLRDPKSQKGVVVAEFDILYHMLEREIAEWLEGYFHGIQEKEKPKEIVFIPYSSVGKKEGKMPAIVCDRLLIAKDGVFEQTDVMVGIAEQHLSPSKEYFLLLHTDLFES